jgi:hypothetical protein
VTRSLRFASFSLASCLLVGGCARLGNDSGGVESGLKDGITRAYGPVESVSCASTDFEANGTKLYDCSVRFADGRTETFCGFEAQGVPVWNRGTCSESPLARA